jgi:hypothetical protein
VVVTGEAKAYEVSVVVHPVDIVRGVSSTTFATGARAPAPLTNDTTFKLPEVGTDTPNSLVAVVGDVVAVAVGNMDGGPTNEMPPPPEDPLPPHDVSKDTPATTSNNVSVVVILILAKLWFTTALP